MSATANKGDGSGSNSSRNNIIFRCYETAAVFENVVTSECLFVNQERNGARDIQVCDKGRIPDLGTPYQIIPVEAIYGIYDLLSGAFVAMVVDSSSMNVLDIRRIEKVLVTPLFRSGRTLPESKQRDEDRYLQLLHLAFTSHVFYFAHDADITLSQQRMAQLTSGQQSEPVWARADSRYFWNREVVADLIASEADKWVVPFMSGYVEYHSECSLGPNNSVKFSLLFISRRSRYNQGCRFTKRGLDENGNSANFVETEQIVVSASGRITSLIQIRGSIPLSWWSPVSMRYDPAVHIDEDRSKSVFRAEKHVADIISTFGKSSDRFDILLVNLVDNKKDQGKLGVAYKEVIDAVQQRIKNRLSYIWFDFHHECKQKGKWNNLSKLVAKVGETFSAQKYFAKEANGTVVSWQQGIVRTNCMDNLDRTNVVQSLFARHSLLQQLGMEANDNVLETPWKEFESVYKLLWVNNANAMSMAYAGSGALKVDFTMTGKRTIGGVIADACSSTMRYYINNFTDGAKQDAIDLMLGSCRPDPSSPSPFIRSFTEEHLSEWLLKLFFASLSIYFTFHYILSKCVCLGSCACAVLALLISAGCVGYMAYSVVIRGSVIGTKLVIRPQLNRDAASFKQR
jgi:hypothetical protein